MKLIYRVFIAALCVGLWFGLDVVATEIVQSAREAPYRKPFPFPCFLRQTDIYAWSLSTGESGAELLIQNVGDNVLQNLKIVFTSKERIFVFRCAEIQPGERMSLREVAGLDCDDCCGVVCVSVTEGKGE
ncbi:MAG: hypothetical protein E7453_05190 [Ruminococcaceae bacterium]|nr:hypothetical protein [Oscillospiraceae bacterium]